MESFNVYAKQVDLLCYGCDDNLFNTYLDDYRKGTVRKDESKGDGGLIFEDI